MNSYERVAAALSHKEADRVPVYPILSGVTRKLVNATYKQWSTDAEICAEAFIKSTEQFDIDCVVTLIDLSVECDAWGRRLYFLKMRLPVLIIPTVLSRTLKTMQKSRKWTIAHLSV